MFMSMGDITHVKFTVVLFNINTTFMLNTIKKFKLPISFCNILSFKGLKTDTSNYACTYIFTISFLRNCVIPHVLDAVHKIAEAWL